MRFPTVTACLTALIIIVYFLSTGSALYPSQQDINFFGALPSNLPGFILHLFFHVGLNHLLSNLLPFIVFAFILEATLSGKDLLAVFFASGVTAAMVFAVLNQANTLIGSSAAIAGIMTAALLLQPKKALPVLVLVVVLLYAAVLPLAASYSNTHFSSQEEEQANLQNQVATLVAQNKLVEAIEVNKTLVVMTQTITQAEEGRQREAMTPSDAVVHVIGSLVAVAYLFFFRFDAVKEGLRQTNELVASITERKL